MLPRLVVMPDPVTTRPWPALLSVQERYAPDSTCFGCGPANPLGLHIRSTEVEGSQDLVCEWRAQPQHEAFPGVLNGGIIATLLDCQANWAAALALMRRHGAHRIAATVTASLEVRYRRPAPTSGPIHLRARAVELDDDRATCEGELVAGGQACATVRATFVAVKPGHPGFHRWERPGG